MLDEPPITHLRRHWALFLGLATAMTVWCVVDVSRRAIVDPARPSLHMTDFTVYTEAGAAFFDGREPYDVANLRGWKYLYPPLFALLVAPLAPLSGPWQASVWFALSAAMALGCYFECRRLLLAMWRRSADGGSSIMTRGERWLVVLSGVSVAFPAFNCLQRGQMGIALVYPLLLGFRLAALGGTPRAWLAGGIVLALPVAFKLTPLLPVAFLLFVLGLRGFALARRTGSALRGGPAGGSEWEIENWRSAPSLARRAGIEIWRRHALGRPLWAGIGVVAGAVTFFLVLPAAMIGWNDNLRHLETWYVRVVSKASDVRADDFGGNVASRRNQSLENAVYRFGNWVAYQFAGGPSDLLADSPGHSLPMDAPVVARGLLVVRGAALLALLAVALTAAWRRDLWLDAGTFGLAAAATLVVSPVARGHYFVLFLPGSLFVPLWLCRHGRRREAYVLAAVPAFLTVAHYVLLDFAGRLGVLGLGTAIWYFTACLAVWRSRSALAATGADRCRPAIAGTIELPPPRKAAG